jgi:hypothetical protein
VEAEEVEQEIVTLVAIVEAAVVTAVASVAEQVISSVAAVLQPLLLVPPECRPTLLLSTRENHPVDAAAAIGG